MIGRKDLTTRFMSLRRGDMSGRIMNQERGIAREKVWGTKPRVALSRQNPLEYNLRFPLLVFPVGPGVSHRCSLAFLFLRLRHNVLRAIIVTRGVDVEKEIFCARQIGKFTKVYKPRADLRQQCPRLVFTFGN
jgi:hypothetical protein